MELFGKVTDLVGCPNLLVNFKRFDVMESL